MPEATTRQGRPPKTIEVRGVRIPTMVYGTAWKEEATSRLTSLALETGFRGFDAANQRRHYFEAGVGEALREAMDAGRVRREELFLQTKFTHLGGQDQRLPYERDAPIARQVEQSFASSLEHLGVERLDAYLLHGPSSYPDLAPQDWEAWRAMEELQRAGRTRLIGVSNVVIDQIEELGRKASVAPAIVQNRCFTRPQADAAVRAFCRRNGIAYQGFSLLTASRALLAHPAVARAAVRNKVEPAQVVLRYCLGAGIVVLTGTTSEAHMRQDLAVYDLDLDDDVVRDLDALFA